MSISFGVGAGTLLQQTLLADDRAIRVGAIHRLDFLEAVVLTHDKWKLDAGGIPRYSFLLATARDAAQPGDDDEVLLLRVEGTAPLSLESDLLAVREESLRDALSRAEDPSPSIVLDRHLDPFTRNRASFTGLKCRVLGTFYEDTVDGQSRLVFGADVDNFYATSTYRVLKPLGEGLSAIASYLRPDSVDGDFVRLGAVRYSATRRRAQAAGQDDAAVNVQIQDFIGHKTALLGMTRSGKSNTAKIIIAKTFIASQQRLHQGKTPIGQLIFDPQGEYANANVQDESAIAGLGADHVRIYKFGADGNEGAHVKPLAVNFFDVKQIGTVQGLIAATLSQQGSAGYVADFAATDFAGGADPSDFSSKNHASRGRLGLYAALIRAGFRRPSNFSVDVSMKREFADAITQELQIAALPASSKKGYVVVPGHEVEKVVLKIAEMRENDVQAAKDFGRELPWTTTEAMATGKSSSNSGRVRGYLNLIPMRAFHDPAVNDDVAEEIYQELVRGRIVIVDLHIGSDKVIRTLSETITEHLLERHTGVFTSGEEPGHIQVMLEEAHNLFSSKAYDNDQDVWVRLAKEAAKLKIGMIYATQEVTGVAHQVKSNTANWVVAHLNNRQELNELSKFYDFGSYADAILASEDRGFVRLKTLSSPFIVPVQIERYAKALIDEAKASASAGGA